MSRVINISQDDLELIKSRLGYPAVETIILDNDKVKDLCIYPALKKYFEYFPIEEKYATTVFQEMQIPFPADVHGAKDVRFVGKDGLGTNRTTSTFLDIVRFQAMGTSGMTKGVFGTPYGFGGLEFQWIHNKILRNSLINNAETFKATVNRSKKQIEVFSSMKCVLNITWCKESRDFNDVIYSEQLKVIDLASSYLLMNLKDVGSIMEDNDSAKKLNISELKERGETLRDEVLKYWQSIPAIFIARG